MGSSSPTTAITATSSGKPRQQASQLELKPASILVKKPKLPAQKSCGKKSHFAACNPEHLHAALDNEAVIKKLASDRGWRQCPNCGTLIEKNEGCGHIMCYCGQKFCYRCSLALGMGRDEWAHEMREKPNVGGVIIMLGLK
ncbi:hypothetical protein F5B19DRAFT_488481 [Rostrohypoxylon terebratum]|nr:hypothetical protein F5B19DRAFT_488481 [Rostrohypoxylon terebratum]